MNEEFVTTTIMKEQSVTISEYASTREQAEGIVKSATVAAFHHNGFPYAVVEVPVLTDLIETWLNHAEERAG
jgi:hypothetical protein